MHQENNFSAPHKRSLKKVRPQFLHKKDDSEEPQNVDPATKYLNGDKMIVLKASVGLVEVNRKIYTGPQYLNPHFKFASSVIEEKPWNKVLRLNLMANQENIPLPWEYVMKRLESYGDLELATTAHKVDKFYSNFRKIMSEYCEAIQTNNSIIKKFWSEVKEKATSACEQVEKNKMFYKVLLHFTKDSDQILQTSYSEGLLQAIGYKAESFLKQLEINGIPTTFEPGCRAFLSATKFYLDFTLFTGGPVHKLPEYESNLLDAKGAKKKITVQANIILEPISDGFLGHFYFIVRDMENSKDNIKRIISESDIEDISSKCIKIESESENNIYVSKEIVHELSEKRM